ncbi:MAG TPA: restriction endonuclease subunit S, partial [Nitrosomonas sp.]|nr:restriction endonuclease subunit S [Nitrosomonas sp.]
QILSGPKEFYIRNWILRNCIVLAIIDLPADSFQPYTGTKTSLVVLQRRSLPLGNLLESDAYKIFMGIPKHIGHDRRGKPVFKYDPTGNITSEVLTDLQEISLAYDAFKTGASDSDFQNIHPDCFSISSKSVESDEYQRLNAKFYAPVNNFSFSIKSNQLEFKKLADVTKKIFYPGRFKRQYTLPNGYETVPFLGGADITSMIVKTEKYISKTFHKYSELAVETGWLLVTRSGTTGIVSMVPQSWQGFAISEHVIRIIPDETKLSPYYILAYLSSRVGQQAMKKGIYGSVIDEITPDFLSNLTIPIPSDISKYEEIHDKIRHAERNRQSAMAGFGGAIKNIEALFQ